MDTTQAAPLCNALDRIGEEISRLRKIAGGDEQLIVTAGTSSLDMRGRTLSIGSRQLKLRPQQVEILAALMAASPQPVAQAALNGAHLGSDSNSSKTTIYHLRQLLGRDAWHLQCVRGSGYCWVSERGK